MFNTERVYFGITPLTAPIEPDERFAYSAPPPPPTTSDPADDWEYAAPETGSLNTDFTDDDPRDLAWYRDAWQGALNTNSAWVRKHEEQQATIRMQKSAIEALQAEVDRLKSEKDDREALRKRIKALETASVARTTAPDEAKRSKTVVERGLEKPENMVAHETTMTRMLAERGRPLNMHYYTDSDGSLCCVTDYPPVKRLQQPRNTWVETADAVYGLPGTKPNGHAPQSFGEMFDAGWTLEEVLDAADEAVLDIVADTGNRYNPPKLDGRILSERRYREATRDD